jgi:hypothetical protein
VEQLARAMANKGAARARMLGKSVEETASILAVYAEQGKQAEEAGTYLDMMWRELSQKAALYGESYRKNGIEVFDELTGEMRQTADIIRDIENALRGKTLEERVKIMNELHVPQRALVAILPLLGKSAELTARYKKTVDDATGSSEKLSDVMLTKLQKAWENFSASVTEVSAIIVDLLYPALEQVFGILSDTAGLHGDILAFWKSMKDGILEFADALNKIPDKDKEWLQTLNDVAHHPIREGFKWLNKNVKEGREIAELQERRAKIKRLQQVFYERTAALGKPNEDEIISGLMKEASRLIKELEDMFGADVVAKIIANMAMVPLKIQDRYPRPVDPVGDQEDLANALEDDPELTKFLEKLLKELETAKEKYEDTKAKVAELLKKGDITSEQADAFLDREFERLFPKSNAENFLDDMTLKLKMLEDGWDDAKKAAWEYLGLEGSTDEGAQRVEAMVRKIEALENAQGFREMLKTDKDRDLEDLARIKELGTQGLLTPEEVEGLAQQFVEKWSDEMEALRPMSTGFTGMAEYARELQNALLGNDKEKLDKDRNKTLIDIKKAAEDTTKAVKDAAKQPARMGA